MWPECWDTEVISNKPAPVCTPLELLWQSPQCHLNSPQSCCWWAVTVPHSLRQRWHLSSVLALLEGSWSEEWWWNAREKSLEKHWPRQGRVSWKRPQRILGCMYIWTIPKATPRRAPGFCSIRMTKLEPGESPQRSGSSTAQRSRVTFTGWKQLTQSHRARVSDAGWELRFPDSWAPSHSLCQWTTVLPYLSLKVLAIQSCLTLCDPMDYSLPGSSVHGISQARILEWVGISLSRGSFRLRDRTRVFCIAGRFFTIWAPREALIWAWTTVNLHATDIYLMPHVQCWECNCPAKQSY